MEFASVFVEINGEKRNLVAGNKSNGVSFRIKIEAGKFNLITGFSNEKWE